MTFVQKKELKKNILHRKFIRAIYLRQRKTILYNQFKIYWNAINRLTKISKENNYQKHFHEHKKNMFKTWNHVYHKHKQKRDKRHKLS